jgi:hypothetical protein
LRQNERLKDHSFSITKNYALRAFFLKPCEGALKGPKDRSSSATLRKRSAPQVKRSSRPAGRSILYTLSSDKFTKGI